MPEIVASPPDEKQQLVLSRLSPGPAQKRLAFLVVLGLSAIFLLITTGLLGGIQTSRVDAFVPAYLTAMFVCDSMTAILLFGEFSILRSRDILVIASGYLFTALMLIPYALTFPGLLAPKGLIGGLQSTSWLYFIQYAGFPLFVIGYALLKDSDPSERSLQGTVRAAIYRSIALTTGVVIAIAFLCVVGEPLLPRVLLDSLHLSPLWPYAGVPVALFSVVAIIVLWYRRRSMLDLWLLVVMSVYAMLIPLSYFSAPVRFSIGWYAVRTYAVLSSSLVLIFLLYEIQTLYARLLGAVLAQRREREARLMTGDAVAASIAHEVKQPLTAMVTSADAGFRFLDRSTPNLERAKEAFKLISADGHRAGAVVENIRANFRSDVRTRTTVDVNELIQDALALERNDLEKHRILVQVEPNMRLPEVRGNRVQLQQVLLNLIANGIYAMLAMDEPRVLSVKSEAYEGDTVMVSVADTGTGVSALDIDRIFNPLFTTKSDGMGMGLSICRAIIEAHNGRLWCSPNTPRGSVFQFTLYANKSISADA
jgi:signal transduction histidine kinase